MLSENASITGKPDTKLALNILPDIASLTENNLPLVPSTVKMFEPLPIISILPLKPAEPVNGKPVPVPPPPPAAREADVKFPPPTIR